MKLPSLSIFHVAAVSAVLSLGMVWLYMKMQRLDNRIQQLSHMVAWTATNQDTSSYLADIGGSAQPPCETSGSCEVKEVTEAPCQVHVAAQDADDAMSIRSEDLKAVMQHIQSGEGGSITPMDEGSLTPVPLSPSSMTHVAVDDDNSGNGDESSPRNLKSKTADELKAFSVEELKTYLKDHNLSIKGNKAELIQRIISM